MDFDPVILPDIWEEKKNLYAESSHVQRHSVSLLPPPPQQPEQIPQHPVATPPIIESTTIESTEENLASETQDDTVALLDPNANSTSVTINPVTTVVSINDDIINNNSLPTIKQTEVTHLHSTPVGNYGSVNQDVNSNVTPYKHRYHSYIPDSYRNPSH